MSAPTKSKSRSRSLKRKQEAPKKEISKPANLSSKPQQKSALLNRSNVNPVKVPLQNENGFSFDNKENRSLNYDEFSPSRITDGAKSGGAQQRK